MNRFGIPADVEQRIRARDSCCVYCSKPFATSRKDMPTIEHLDEKSPFQWPLRLLEDGLAICCGSCNSSRGNKSLRDWFQTPYCTQRDINSTTVAEPVRRYIARDDVASSGGGTPSAV